MLYCHPSANCMVNAKLECTHKYFHIAIGLLTSFVKLINVENSYDFYSDHFLGYSDGPLRIHRYDVLISILYHPMLLDNPGVA